MILPWDRDAGTYSPANPTTKPLATILEHIAMRITTLSILAALLITQNLCGQDRIVSGRVISEDLEPLPMVYIQSSDTILLGKTDMDGRFMIRIPKETERLLFCFVGMEQTEIKLKKDCDTIEVAMLYDGTYDFMSSRKIDRLRKKRFDKLPIVHSEAVRNGLFKNNNICYDRVFKPDKPLLDEISKELKELRKANKNDFNELNVGDIVKIPFGIDTSKNENRVSTHYSLCRNCTEKDYKYLIEGKIINKHKRKLTLEIEITKMLPYYFLKYRGKVLKVGGNFKYEMKYFEVIIDKKRLPTRG